MAPKTPADLLSLSDAALTDLGFDPALLKAWTLATLSIPDVQALSPATLTALKIGPLKTLTTENLKAITDAGDAKKILDAVNGLLLTNRTDFPFDQITLAQLESLDNASLTALGFDGTKLKALDPTALNSLICFLSPTRPCKFLGIPALRGVTLSALKAVTDATDITALNTAIAPATLPTMTAADFGKLTLANLQGLNDLATSGFDPPSAVILKAINHSKLLPLSLAALLTLPASVLASRD